MILTLEISEFAQGISDALQVASIFLIAADETQGFRPRFFSHFPRKDETGALGPVSGSHFELGFRDRSEEHSLHRRSSTERRHFARISRKPRFSQIMYKTRNRRSNRTFR